MATVACIIWVGSGHQQPLHHPGGGGGVQSFYKMFGQEIIVGSKYLFCYTGSRQEI